MSRPWSSGGDTQRNRARRRLGVLAALLLMSACGRGGGNGTTTLAGDDAVEGAVGVGLSTGLALSALFLDVELSIGEVMAEAATGRERRGSGGGVGVDQIACDLGGSQSTTCEVDSRGRTTIDIRFSDCRSAEDDGGRRKRDGQVRLVALDPLVCITGRLGEGAPFSLHLDHFHSRLDDVEGRQRAAFTANLTETIARASNGCLTSDGTRSADGSLDFQIAELGIDISLEASDLHFEVDSAGSPCEQTILANGLMKIDDRANGLRFAQVLDNTQITLGGNVHRPLVSIDGEIDNDCLGDLHFSTITAVQVTSPDGCPVAGSFVVSVAGDDEGRVEFRSDGVDLDFGNDGSTDESVDSCRDPSLAQCAR